MPSHQENMFTTLRSLPGYNVGDPLRHADEVLFTEEATASAMTTLRPDDCVFISRSNGSFTYALYGGPSERDPTAMSFQVSESGHFKIVYSVQEFLNHVRVPAFSLSEAPVVTPLRLSLKHRTSFTRREDSGSVLDDSSSASPDVKMPTSSLHKMRSSTSLRRTLKRKTSVIRRASSFLDDNSIRDVTQWDLSFHDSISSPIDPPSAAEVKPLSTPSSRSQSFSTLPTRVTNQVQCIPEYKAGMDVYYKKQNEIPVSARILEVHWDDLLHPFYTIQLEDGREKQTDSDHLTLECDIHSPVDPPSIDEVKLLSRPNHRSRSCSTLLATNSVANQVQCIPEYKSGMDVYYKKQNEIPVSARILEVHWDDLLHPFYTIQLDDGREKQTDNDHLTLAC